MAIRHEGRSQAAVDGRDGLEFLALKDTRMLDIVEGTHNSDFDCGTNARLRGLRQGFKISRS